MVNSTLEEDDLWYFGDRKNLKRRYMNKNLVVDKKKNKKQEPCIFYIVDAVKKKESNTYIL